jgi:hypothetical protein
MSLHFAMLVGPKRSGPFTSVLVQNWGLAQPIKGVNQASEAWP